MTEVATELRKSSRIESVTEKINKEKSIRRSGRDPSIALLERTDVKRLLWKIRTNQKDTVVLKVKHHILADINSVVLDEIIAALAKNRCCQALYLQNLSNAMKDDQLRALIKVLQKKMIWCLNIGENYEVSTQCWEYFGKMLPHTFVTHLYVSEHIININLKNKMRKNIRLNRRKHDKHCSLKNLKVIEKCTNMWWNPINGVKFPVEYVEEEEEEEEAELMEEEYDGSKVVILTPRDNAYWQEGVGPGGEKPWKFRCSCGQECSSYENYRYHAVGRMFECTECSKWAHVDCVWGAKISDEDIEEMEDIHCSACRTKMRRTAKMIGGDTFLYYCQREQALLALGSGNRRSYDEAIGLKRKREQEIEESSKIDDVSSISMDEGSINTQSANGDQPVDRSPWKFICICGETCSSYEKVLYQPKGEVFSCTGCSLRGHVICYYGPKVKLVDVLKMPDAMCRGCKSKNRRRRGMDPSGSYDNRGTGEPIHKENSNQYDVSEPLGKRADDDLHFATPIVVVESVSSLERSSIVDIDGTTDCGTLDGSVIGDRKAAECQPADPKYAQELSNLAKTNEQQTQDCPLDSFDGESDSGTANELTIIETVITETLPTKSAFTDFL